MKYLLTSAGIKNRSIHNALLDLLGKPIADCSALCIPTAGYGHPLSGPGRAWNFISGKEPQCPMCELGWKSLGVLELTALPSIDKKRWVGWVRQADVLLVNGGDAVYLGHWMRQSGLADLLPSLDKTVWVGLSAGSMVMTPRVGEEFVESKPSITGDDITLGVVDFSIFPHVDHLICRRTPWRPQRDGRPVSEVRHTRSTIKPPLRSWMASLRSYPKDIGNGLRGDETWQGVLPNAGKCYV